MTPTGFEPAAFASEVQRTTIVLRGQIQMVFGLNGRFSGSSCLLSSNFLIYIRFNLFRSIKISYFVRKYILRYLLRSIRLNTHTLFDFERTFLSFRFRFSLHLLGKIIRCIRYFLNYWIISIRC